MGNVDAGNRPLEGHGGNAGPIGKIQVAEGVARPPDGIHVVLPAGVHANVVDEHVGAIAEF